jgi:two-component sensor histidine kinase
MNLVAILSLVVFVLYLQVGLFVLVKNPSSKVNRWFFYLTLCFSVWSLGFLFSYKSPGIEQTVLWDSISLAGWLLFPVFMIRFKTLLTNYPNSESMRRYLFGAALFVSIGFLVYFILFAGPHRQIVDTGEGYFYLNNPLNPVYLALNLYITISFVITVFILLRWRMRMVNQLEKMQFNLVFFPLVIFIAFSVISDVLLPILSPELFPRMAHIFSFFWLGGVAYGILRLRFFVLTPSLAADRVIEEIKQVLFFCDTRGRVLRSNAFTEKLLRIRSSRLPGRIVTDLFAEEKEIENYIEWAIKNGYAGPVELNLRSFQGELIPVNISIAQVMDRFYDAQGIMVYGQDNREAIKLRNEIFMREQVERRLRAVSEVLEIKVKERTEELAASYKELQVKMTERLRVEEQIKADIAEKDVLINEIHNRVKSNMDLIIALINTYQHKGFPPKVNKKFRELSRRVMAILLVHENLYLSLNYSEVDFSVFLREIVQQLVVFYKKEDKVRVELEISDVFLDIDHSIPLGIVANEIISNALDHGFSHYYLRKKDRQEAILRVTYGQVNGVIELSVSDNGRGLPPDFDIFGNKTNGLPLVDVLVNDQINGSIEFNSKSGTLVTVRFPAMKI